MFAESDGNFGHFKIIFTSFFFVIAVGFRYYSFSQATFRSAPDNESSEGSSALKSCFIGGAFMILKVILS